tara:strand:+ start:123 stop:392 length:270 start_codon:yes stop_codon:yes gene_type:complete
MRVQDPIFTTGNLPFAIMFPMVLGDTDSKSAATSELTKIFCTGTATTFLISFISNSSNKTLIRRNTPPGLTFLLYYIHSPVSSLLFMYF